MKEYISILSKDGLKIATFSNRFKSEKGVMIITHGMGEHSMRYMEMVDFFTNVGYTVISFDIRGHGLSEGKRGHTPGYEFLMDDIERVYNQVKERSSISAHFFIWPQYGWELGTEFFAQRAK